MNPEIENNELQQEETQKPTTARSYSDNKEINQGENQQPARPQRPRIRIQRAYSAGQNQNGEPAFRPEGFGENLPNDNTQEKPYRRYNPQGYQPRGNYQPRQQQGYRPRYNNNGEQQEGGYQQRPQQPRFNRPQYQQGYRPRYNNNGEQQEGGYQRRPQQGGYQPRQQQGYRPRFNYGENQEGGFQEGRPAYRPQQGQYRGNYQQRPQQGFRQQGQFNRYNNQRGPQHNYSPDQKYSLKKRIEYKEENVDPTQPLRLNKFLANAGICSRREADEFIQNGMVTVNGNVVTELGTKILRTDEVVFKGKPVSPEKKVYVLLNKPKDYVTTSDDPQQRKTVMELVKDACPERIYPVGRLDRNTTGVLLFTNDGDLASKLTHPKFLKKKVYHVFLDKSLTAHDLQQIAEGVTLEDGEVHADAIEYADENDKSQVGIEIHSGKNRIVRRIFESLGYRVVKLDRVQFAGLTKKNVRRGDWRFLTEKEVEMLRMGAFE